MAEVGWQTSDSRWHKAVCYKVNTFWFGAHSAIRHHDSFFVIVMSGWGPAAVKEPGTVS